MCFNRFNCQNNRETVSEKKTHFSYSYFQIHFMILMTEADRRKHEAQYSARLTTKLKKIHQPQFDNLLTILDFKEEFSPKFCTTICICFHYKIQLQQDVPSQDQ